MSLIPKLRDTEFHKMDRERFDEEVRSLERTIWNSVEGHFTQRGIKFDAFKLQATVCFDLDEFARAAHYFGADIIPADIPTKV